MICPLCEGNFQKLNSENVILYCCINCADDRHNIWSWIYTHHNGDVIKFNFSWNLVSGIHIYESGLLTAKQTAYLHPEDRKNRKLYSVYDVNWKADYKIDLNNENSVIDLAQSIHNRINRIINFK